MDTKTLYWQSVGVERRWECATVKRGVSGGLHGVDARHASVAGFSAYGESSTKEYELTWHLNASTSWVIESLEVRIIGLESNRRSLNRSLFLCRSHDGSWSSETVASESASGAAPLPPPGMANAAVLNGVADCDLDFNPMTPALPLRRISMGAGEPGASANFGLDRGLHVMVARVELPTLRVFAVSRTYTSEMISTSGGPVGMVGGVNSVGTDGVEAARRVRYSGDDFVSVLQLDSDGYILDYSGVARRVQDLAASA
ncbi:hypothetical protein EH165_05830 [Nakamurella antarctica]|uniref:Uncharacterized protein n=1 Tax=Nakamurella antarctica TaxID=1902245 RepID=A0A3G8ZLT1_9ACTN|nr:putative glycolipid-binding domain-containing protein [Nakamurella antarctica]AZI57737.1 hypothetical protein EH165_05830 [Nakamurella antarctica]